ncbi:spermatogenesis associated 6-like protein isoform X1 [Amyelois transitella]|uniref:spermatogenesis associated 6-like protein isoform X1 n=1 Tax=Amyelois transitella TaxID=680683 RepID=UPI00067C70CE|nr:spermatogenesis associated 6-like protein isoform X1 [Amyelois transitella]
MPKIIELTVEIDVQRVSCPGVWLCQDGRVSLTIFALGTSYQTCLLPPLFPLMFKDVFYFRNRFQETCALNNICCLLKDETIYCELVQWCDDCSMTDCKVLAQYLGALNDVLFPPNMCSNDGVDLLMRRSKDFPGILAPKIEIKTKVRIDEIWDQKIKLSNVKVIPCGCLGFEGARQKPVCHSAQYHRNKCNSITRDSSLTKSRSLSRSRSGGSRCCSLTQEPRDPCECPRSSTETDKPGKVSSPEMPKVILESRYVNVDNFNEYNANARPKSYQTFVTPCICDICKRYHELFHTDVSR